MSDKVQIKEAWIKCEDSTERMFHLLEAASIMKRLEELQNEIKKWQDLFDEEFNLAPHQRHRYNTSAHDAKILFEQRRFLRDKD